MKKLLKRLFPDTHPVRLLAHQWKNSFVAWKAGFPAKNLTVICVTGTDGKTTTVAMTAHILHSCDIKVGAVSTAFFQIGGKREPNPTQKTSVDAGTLQRFLRRLVNEGYTHVVIEASSHGLMQGRLAGIHPSVAAITNISMEHLDYHGTMDEYIAAKGILFRTLKGKGTKVLNEDDQTFHAYEHIPSEQTITYSPRQQLSNLQSEGNIVSADFSIDGTTLPLTVSVPGLFNLENALAAIGCAKACGIDAKKAVDALSTFQGAGGRMERIDVGQPFGVFIDFTVTPAAYERTLHSAREFAKNNRVLVLTGSCGDRMKEKRPVIGKICTTMADITVVTNEDPYTEDPEQIIDEVLSGIDEKVPLYRSVHDVPANAAKYCLRLSDRMEAIQFILKQAKPGDVVLLCGKGADITMMTKSGQIPWNEKEIVTRELASGR
jgi:UDP-N-acetylmuramoyl-L-alanyl-D-glutamate--2,6-diaminopimelate ligase